MMMMVMNVIIPTYSLDLAAKLSSFKVEVDELTQKTFMLLLDLLREEEVRAVVNVIALFHVASECHHYI